MGTRGGWRPGGGRPKAPHTLEAEKAKALIIQRVVESLEPILKALINKAKKGDAKAAQELFNRAFGKPPQAFELPEGSGQIVIRWKK